MALHRTDPMADEIPYDVFLSHSAKDKAVVRDVAEQLRKDGVKVWFDEWVLKPGDSIPAKIEEGWSPLACAFVSIPDHETSRICRRHICRASCSIHLSSGSSVDIVPHFGERQRICVHRWFG